MLLEGYKFNVNPKRPRYRTKGSMPAKDVIKKFASKKATRYAIGTFIAGAAMERMTAPHVSKAKKWLVRRDVERQNKKLAKRAAKMQKQRMDENYLWKKIKPHLQKSKAGGKLLAKHGPKVQKAVDIAWGGSKVVTGTVGRLAKKHPVVSAGLGVAAAVGGSAAKDVAKHYIAHKVKMKDPVYAQHARKAAAKEKALKQAKKIKENTSPSPEARTTAHHGDEHPSPQAYKMSKGGHKKHHAHHAVMRGMQPNTINTAGLAGGKFQLTNRTKTNTRKESHMNLDNIIERAADNIYAIEEASIRGRVAGLTKKAIHWSQKTGIPAAKKHIATAKRKAAPYLQAGLKKTRVAAQKGLDYLHGQAQIHQMKRRSVSETMIEKAGDIYEIGPLAFGAIKLGSRLLAGAAAKKASSVVKKKIMPRRESVDEVWGQVAKFAVKNPGKTAAIVKTAAKFSPVGFGLKMAKKNFKKGLGLKEAMAPGARSQFEINRVKDVRQFYGMQRSQHVDAAAAKAAELRKKINLRGGAEVKESAKDILQKARGFAKRYPRTAKGASIMAATLAASEVLKRHKGFQAKRATYHQRKYNRAAARYDYLSAKKQNKAELKAALKETAVDKVGQFKRDKTKAARRELAKALLQRRLDAKKKSVKEERTPNPDWRREQIEKWKAKEAEKKKDKENEDKKKD